MMKMENQMKKTLIFLAMTTLIVLLPLRSAAQSAATRGSGVDATVARSKTLTVAVIDTGIDASEAHLCKYGHKSFVSTLPNPLSDEHGHGTHIAGIINANAYEGDYCLVSIKYYNPNADGKQNLDTFIKAVRYAINIK